MVLPGKEVIMKKINPQRYRNGDWKICKHKPDKYGGKL